MKWTPQRKEIVKKAVQDNNGKIRMSHAFDIYTQNSQAKETIKIMENKEFVEKASTPGVFKVLEHNIPEEKFPELDLRDEPEETVDREEIRKQKALQESSEYLDPITEEQQERQQHKKGFLHRFREKLAELIKP